MAYGISLGRRGTNGTEYADFVRIVMQKYSSIIHERDGSLNLLKYLDEYNVCHYRGDWL